jgi:DNA-binding NtrC family response regulator
VRELQHVVERALILSRGGNLDFGELLSSGSSSRPHATPAHAGDLTAPSELPGLADLKQLERRIIETAWIAADRKVSGKDGAAAALGVPASTLESKLRSHGLK